MTEVRDLSYEQLDLLRKIAKHVAVEEDIFSALQNIVQWLSEDSGLERGVISLLGENDEEIQAHITANEIPSSRSDRMRYRPEIARNGIAPHG